MEKFSRYNDEATGISPFAEEKRAPATSVGGLIRLVWAAVVTPLVYLVLLVYLHLLYYVLPYPLSAAVIKPVVSLYVSGKRSAELSSAKSGSIFASNFVSPFDPLVFEFQHRCLFAVPAEDGGFVKLDLPKMVRYALHPHKVKIGSELKQLVEAAKKQNSVIVIFVEGTTSNGKGILSVPKLNVNSFSTVDSEVYPASVRYDSANVYTAFPRTLFGYLFRTARIEPAEYVVVGGRQAVVVKGLSSGELVKRIAGLQKHYVLTDRMTPELKEAYVDAMKRN